MDHASPLQERRRNVFVLAGQQELGVKKNRCGSQYSLGFNLFYLLVFLTAEDTENSEEMGNEEIFLFIGLQTLIVKESWITFPTRQITVYPQEVFTK